MRFDLIDSVLEMDADTIVTLKQVTAAEEYLQDHFPTFPILPGVLMIEAMAQAARRLLRERDPALETHVLGEVRAVKYGAMVKPGQALMVTVTLAGEQDGVYAFKGVGVVENEYDAESRTAVSGRFTMRPLRIGVREPEAAGAAPPR